VHWSPVPEAIAHNLAVIRRITSNLIGPIRSNEKEASKHEDSSPALGIAIAPNYSDSADVASEVRVRALVWQKERDE
jgi:hypothetical protein